MPEESRPMFHPHPGKKRWWIEWAVIGLLLIMACVVLPGAPKLFRFQIGYFTKSRGSSNDKYGHPGIPELEAKEPASPDWKYLIGQAQAGEAQGMSNYQRAIQIEPGKPLPYLLLARARMRKISFSRRKTDEDWENNYIEAVESVEAARRADPKNALLDYSLACLYFKNKENEKALACLRSGAMRARLDFYREDIFSAIAYYLTSEGVPETEARVFARSFGYHWYLERVARSAASLAYEAKARGDHEAAIAIYHDIFRMINQARSLSCESIEFEICHMMMRHMLRGTDGAYDPPEKLPEELPWHLRRTLGREYFKQYLAAHGAEEFALKFEKETTAINRLWAKARSSPENDSISRFVLSRYALLQFWTYSIITLVLLVSILLVLLLLTIRSRNSFPPINVGIRDMVIVMLFVLGPPVAFLLTTLLGFFSWNTGLTLLGVFVGFRCCSLYWCVVYPCFTFIIVFGCLCPYSKVTQGEGQKYSDIRWIHALSRAMLPKLLIFVLAFYLATTFGILHLGRVLNNHLDKVTVNEVGE